MSAPKSNYASLGRYGYGGGTVDFGSRLGWWNRVTLPKSTTDLSFTVTSKYVGRPDAIAYDVYGQSTLMWVILQYNNIMDVNTELVQGKVISLPTKSRLFTELLSKRQSAIPQK